MKKEELIKKIETTYSVVEFMKLKPEILAHLKKKPGAGEQTEKGDKQ